ncbi:MAG: alpha/beta hydrolase [Candidatus Promineifilaceae bacterium]
MLNERFIQLGEVALNVVDGPPSGTPLLLIHGGGNRWQEFLPIIPGLAMRWHIYALDLRGHGKSGWVAGQYRPEHYAADVLALIEALALDRVILFGHSLGGWIALEAAARLGKKVHALILGDPPLNIERFVVDESREARIDMWRGLRDLVSMELNVDELASALAEIPVSVSEAGVRFDTVISRV